MSVVNNPRRFGFGLGRARDDMQSLGRGAKTVGNGVVKGAKTVGNGIQRVRDQVKDKSIAAKNAVVNAEIPQRTGNLAVGVANTTAIAVAVPIAGAAAVAGVAVLGAAGIAGGAVVGSAALAGAATASVTKGTAGLLNGGLPGAFHGATFDAFKNTNTEENVATRMANSAFTVKGPNRLNGTQREGVNFLEKVEEHFGNIDASANTDPDKPKRFRPAKFIGNEFYQRKERLEARADGARAVEAARAARVARVAPASSQASQVSLTDYKNISFDDNIIKERISI